MSLAKNGKVFQKFSVGDRAVITQVDLRERVTLVMFQMSRHINAQSQIFDRIDGCDPVSAEKIPGVFWKDQKLLPQRTGLSATRGELRRSAYTISREFVRPRWPASAPAERAGGWVTRSRRGDGHHGPRREAR